MILSKTESYECTYEYSKAKIHIWFEGNFFNVYLKIITQKIMFVP